MAVLGAIACCNGDTWASELGSVLSRADPFLITTFKPVPRVTTIYLSTFYHDIIIREPMEECQWRVCCQALLEVWSLELLSTLESFSPAPALTWDKPDLSWWSSYWEVQEVSWAHWLTVFLVPGEKRLLEKYFCNLCYFSLQFSGKDLKSGKIVEVSREGVVPISGKMILDNHSVNLVSSILTALLLPKVALALGMWRNTLQQLASFNGILIKWSNEEAKPFHDN